MQIEKDELLNQAKELLKEEVTQIAYETWFSPMTITEMTNNKIVLKASSPYAKEMLETRYADLVLNTFKFITNKDWTVSVFAYEDGKSGESEGVIVSNNQYSQEPEIETSNRTLNPKYTFDTFVVGNNNRFAHAAAIAVGDKPGESYNPLFLYGGVGLGKTHLMQAIGNRILQNNRAAKILYVTSEKFTNQLINAIKDNKNEVFRNKYRTIDVLLIDDIQFIAGKERVQEEFFHTFNALYEANKQIVLTSDRPPKEIHTLEDRLKTRFEWGLLADIQPPDYETRMAIIHVKADSLRVQLPEDVVDYIAKTITSNVRQLEGTVKKIKALHDLMERAIDIELAKEAVADIFKENPGLNPTPEMILREVSRYYCTPVEKLKGSGRSKDLVLPRQVAMYLVRDLTDYSLPEIGKIFSRDHTTVLHSINKIENYLKETSEMDNIIKTLKTNIRG